ncbi:hypothetical protein AWA1501_27250 [Lactiplantibacillus pentosus]|uniref:bacterial Ig-like domain-containing protein n=1 Tax=Lactiplantibacillus pentosus TaxID=1589 RepID=UPI001B1D8E99|nr:bacterial Ig-like domain-containing protein [Lactiplantibacillus pentosus]GIP70562.1 hypothetical protein AWA1501_27250 [Lactiplantibacillus pentosus]
MKNNQEYVMMAARKNRRFWLAAGTALLVWQVNNQTAQADVQQTPTSSADTTVVTANATAASNVVQLQSGTKTSTKTTPTAESTKTDSTSPQQSGSDSQATSASGTASSAAKTGESGQAASDLTAEADNRAKSVSTTPYTDGDNAVENKQNTTTVTTSADKSATRSQSTTETGTTPAQSVETDKAGYAGDSVPVDSATKADQVNDTSLSNDGYDAVSTDVNSSQPSETDKTGTDKTQSSTDGIDSQTVTDEKTSAGLTADSLSSLQPRLAQVQASSLQLDTVDAAPTVAQDYAAWDAITDTTRKGIMGTSEWWIDDSDNTLHLGAGQLADANVQFDDNAEVTDWGNVGWGQYVEAHNAKLTLALEGSIAVGTNARGLFNGLTFDLSNEEDPKTYFSQISVEQTTDMSYMFERVTFMTSWVALNLWSSSADSVNASHMFENVRCIGNADRDKRVLVALPALAEAYSDTSYMFNNSGFSSIAMATSASDASKLTSQVTSMAYMFNNCTQLMSLDLSKFDTHNVTDMSHMFNGDENLGKLVISTYSPNNPDQTFDTSNVTNMSHMFTRCDALGNLDVSGFMTSKVTNMSHMFEYCYATTLDVANFDTSQVTDMQAMFNNAVHVKTLDLSNFDTHLITNMDNMFTNCESLTSLILPTHFVDQQVTSMKQMFTNCATLTSIDLVDDFDTRNVTNMDQLFSGCQKLTSLDVSQLDTSHITNMADFFNDCESLTNIEGLTHLNTASVTTMANMFSNCRSLTALDLSNFETSRVTTMANMFNNCASLPALDVSSLDTSQVVNMANMFAGCAALSALDTTPLKTTNVTNMSGMFKGDRALVSLDISKLGTGQVTTMSHMFEDVFADQKVQSFTGLEKLDTSNVTDMSYMFAGFFLPVAMSLNLVNFDTRKVLNMQGMFKGYVNFKDNYLSYLQTGNVTDMSYMLSGLVNHTQFTWSNNLDTHSVTTMAYMFSDSPDMETFVWKQQLSMDQVTDMQGMFANDIALVHVDFDQFDTSQVMDMTAMFSGDTRLATLDLTSFDTSNVESMYKMFYLDSALKNLNLSSFSGEKLQLTYATLLPLRVFGLFNLIMDDTNDSEPQMGLYQTHLNTLILGQKTRLSLSKPTSVIDWVDASTAEGKEIIAEFSTVEALEQALAQFGLKPDWLVSADLAPSQGFDGVWINNATAETLTSEQLMARYDGTNSLATDATWTWQNILGKDLQVISGTNSTWAPKDSLAGLIDTSKTVDDLTTTVTDATTNQTLTSSQLNALLQQPAHSGEYQVAYQYTDGDGTKQISVPVTLSLVANQSLITTKDSVLQLGTTWTAADNIASLLDADGSVTDLTKVNGVVSVNGIENGTVGTTIPGVYQIDYQITDSTGMVRTATATVIVNGLTLKETQVNVSTDDRWDPLTNIDKAIDDQGNEATVELTITDANDAEVANIKKPGSYQLNYHFTDAHGEHTATAAVNVKADENHADLQVKDSRVYQFGTWTPTDNFVSAMDSDGETLDISALSVTGTVDLNQVGKYTITYQFTDQFGVAHSAQATVEVLENQAAISLDNNSGTLYANGIWNPASVVVNATDVDGSTVEDARIKCSGTVDMTTPGENKLTYSFVDSLGKEHSKDTTVMVLENLAGIKVKSTTESFRIGAKWSEENNFDSATDVDGTSVDLSNVAIESTVNSEVVGQYKVTYSFTDQQGQLRSIVVPVEVLANLADIRVKSKTESFRIGAKWSAEDNFDSATDVDGTPLGLSNVDVKSTVNTEVVGQYKVTYSFTDQQGKLRSVEVPVEVLANLAGIKAKSATESFRIGAKWSAKDNFDGATDVDGTPIDLADVDITSTVDPEKVGQYKVTYSFTDQQGELRSVEVPVEVLANLAGIRVKSTTESFRIGAKWSAKDNFESATNVDGTAVALSDVDVTSTVDPETVGQYKVTYSFTDQQGKLRSVEVPVEVLANLAGIRVKFTTESFRIGAKWSAKDNFDSATDVDGTPINLSNIDIESTVNLEVAGQYKVTYSFTDQQGKLRNVEVPVDVLANMAGIKVKSKTESFRIGAKWSEKDNFDGATDVDGTPIDLADVDVISTVDPEKVGQHKVTYSFTDQQGQLRKAEVPVEVLANLADIKVKFTTESFRIGAKWSAEDNFDSATDVDGTPINLSNIDVENTVNSERVGQYKVTYSFIDQQGELRSIEVPVEVLANLAGIKVKSTAESFRIGAKWSEEDNFDSATDVDGTPINLSNIDIESTVNSEVAGQYKVTYSFTDQQGKLRSAEVPVGVLANLAGIKVKSTTESFRIGAKWSEKDNFDSATDVDGTPINLSNIDIESTVNSEVVGQYKVTYSFTDQQGKLRSVEVPVEVLANLAGIRVKSTTESFRIGATWSEKDNFDGATDVDGTPIDLADVDITSTVDPEKVGQYKVTYSFTDQQGELRSVEVPVEVLANLASIKVKSTTESFRIGEKWSEENNFDSATDVDGTPLGLSNVDVESTVNPEVVGQYKVTYSFTDQQGQLRKADVTVNVLANLAGIKVKASTENFRIGAKWSEKDNFDSATDVDGTPIDLADVNIISTVDPKAVGKYEVTYSFTDQQGQIRSVEVPVEVLANLAGIKVKSATESFRIGAKWSGKDNFESATNVDGTAVALSDVDVTSTVDPEKVGQYKVTYSFIDQQGQLRKAEVTVDVLANLAGIKVKSTTESFRIGAKWSEKDNFDSATDVDGTPINLADVNITSTVDSTAVGQYKVTYSFTDQQGKLRSIEVPVEVLANLAGIKVKSTAESFRIGAKWSEKDNFDCATNVDGTAVALSDVDITSTVDSKAVGQYMVTYSFTDQQGTVQQVIVPVNVLANYANLQLNQTELSFRAGDNRWQPESNIAAATDIDGRTIDLATMQITNAVDSTTPGTYLVNYAFTDSFNQTHRATATVTVLDNLAALTMTQQHVTLYLGNRQWQPEDNFGGAKNVDGSAITFDQLQVLGHYDLKVVGDYELTYQFTDQLDHLRTAQFTVTVAENQATIVVEKTAVTVHVGDTWVPMMNFVSATDMDGQAIAEDRISVNVTKLNQRLRLMMMRSRALPIVDTTVVGSYQVSYQFIDGNGNLQELATTVTVLPNESALKLAANDITLYAGDEWQPMANVVKATNVDGTPVMADQLRISGSVNSNVVGQYRVLYSFVDQQNKLQQAVTTVNVLANQAALLLKHDQVALTVGDEWQPLANLQLARDVDGHEIASTDLVIDGQVDTATPGTYQVRYHFTDMRGHEQQAVAMVTVVEPVVVDQALLRLHAETVTLRAGATWAPLSNVAEVLDSDGSAQTSEQVSVQGTVDLNQAGKYLLTYHFLDQLGHDHSATATVIVLENEASLKLRTTAVTLKVGQKWDATANILAATDVDGRSINEAVVITDDVDWQRPGIYQLTYELVDQQGKLHLAKTMITLIAADDGSGNQGGNGNADNGSGNQGGNGNTDNGSGNQGDNGNTDNGSGNQGGNGNTGNGSGNQGGNGNTDNGSGNQGGNGNTDNGSGNQGGNGNTDNGSGNQGGNGNTDNGSDNQGGNGNTDNGSGNQGGNSDADNGSGNQDGNGNTDTNSDNQGTKADDDEVSNNNLNTNHQVDTDRIHDADNNSGQKEVAKPNSVSHENGANATVKAAVAKHQSITADSVKSTTNTKTNKQPSVGSPTQLPQTDEHNAGTTNWWTWLGIALAGLITMVKPTKKKKK